jgi:hypothetical protein
MLSNQQLQIPPNPFMVIQTNTSTKKTLEATDTEEEGVRGKSIEKN